MTRASVRLGVQRLQAQTAVMEMLEITTYKLIRIRVSKSNVRFGDVGSVMCDRMSRGTSAVVLGFAPGDY